MAEAGIHSRLEQLPAICFLDLTGYTRLTQERGDEAAAELATTLARLVQRSSVRHGGKPIKWLGDGVMFFFPDPGPGVRAALEMVDTLADAGLPPAHVGLHAGPVLYQQGDYYGQTVNLTARIADYARSGEVLVTPGGRRRLARGRDRVRGCRCRRAEGRLRRGAPVARPPRVTWQATATVERKEGVLFMRRLSSMVVASMLITSMLGSIPAARAGGGETFYLALGTSLAVGFQPHHGATPNGYVDVLWQRMQAQIPGLNLRNLGCPGETSSSMIHGTHPACRYPEGSQLDAAVAFLERTPDRSRSSRSRSAPTTSSADASGTHTGSTGRARPTCFPDCRAGLRISSMRWPLRDRACRSSA